VDGCFVAVVIGAGLSGLGVAGWAGCGCGDLFSFGGDFGSFVFG